VKKTIPLALFDSLQYINDQENFPYLNKDYRLADIQIALRFLKHYKGSQGVIPPRNNNCIYRRFCMKKSRFNNSQILSILKQAEAGCPVPEICWEHGLSRATFYKSNTVGWICQ
jgi:hypothetical protein